jgi:hypothetical protein
MTGEGTDRSLQVSSKAENETGNYSLRDRVLVKFSADKRKSSTKCSAGKNKDIQGLKTSKVILPLS